MDYDDEFQIDGLIDRLKQFVGADPGNAALHFNLGMAFTRKEMLEDAEFAFNMAIELDPNLVEALINLGGIHLRRGKLDEAIESNEKALAINPRAFLAHNNIGFAKMMKSELEAAAESFRKALELQGDLIQARINLARVLGELGDSDGSMAEYHLIVEANPGFALAHYNLALGYLSKGDGPAATKYLTEAVKLNFPVDEQVKKQIDDLP